MENRKCDWCGHGYPAEMMEGVTVGAKAMLWCPECFKTLEKSKEYQPSYSGQEWDGLRGCINCGNDTTGTYCHSCAHQNMIDKYG